MSHQTRPDIDALYKRAKDLRHRIASLELRLVGAINASYKASTIERLQEAIDTLEDEFITTMNTINAHT